MQESLKLIDEIITPYIEKELQMLDLGEEQQALLIIDIFIIFTIIFEITGKRQIGRKFLRSVLEIIF